MNLRLAGLGLILINLAWFVGTGCAGEGADEFAALFPRAGACGDAYLEAIESSMSLETDTLVAGETTGLRLFMPIPGSVDPILQTYQVVVTLPAGFGFEGFGMPGDPTGQWDFEWANPNGDFDEGAIGFTIPHRALGTSSAYADANTTGAYDAGNDPVATYTTGAGSAHVFTLVLPMGGAALGGGCTYFDFDGRYVLNDGIVRLPAQAATYMVSVVATSIDLDTGDADDQSGTAPTVYQRMVPLTVPEPSGGLAGSAAVAALATLATLRGHRSRA